MALSRHAQEEAAADGITDEQIRGVLMEPEGEDIPDGSKAVFRQKNGVRLVILLDPVPYRGAKLVVTLYRIKPQASAKG